MTEVIEAGKPKAKKRKAKRGRPKGSKNKTGAKRGRKPKNEMAAKLRSLIDHVKAIEDMGYTVTLS